MEVNNIKAMREAMKIIYLTATKAFFRTMGYDVACDIIRATARHALAAPPRNCDVGTAEEQEKRYIKLKIEHIDRITKCPHVGYSSFTDSLYLAQMPYEEKEGGAYGV